MTELKPVATDEDHAALDSSSRSLPSDELNKKIITILQQDGRIPYKDIASELNVSEGTVRNRVNRMKDAGVLKIVALADPVAIRYQSDAMIGIKISSVSTPARVAERLSACQEVIYIVWVSGRYDLLIEIVSDSTEQFREFLQNHCFDNPDIGSFEVMTAIDMFKNQFFLKRQPG
jgi:Lrp/AsnC family transcriptional regulator for asnA, asnC and gidA